VTRQPRQELLPRRTQTHHDFPPISTIAPPLDHASPDQAIHQLHRGVMSQLNDILVPHPGRLK